MIISYLFINKARFYWKSIDCCFNVVNVVSYHLILNNGNQFSKSHEVDLFPECMTSNGEDYGGIQQKTSTGNICLNWRSLNSQTSNFCFYFWRVCMFVWIFIIKFETTFQLWKQHPQNNVIIFEEIKLGYVQSSIFTDCIHKLEGAVYKPSMLLIIDLINYGYVMLCMTWTCCPDDIISSTQKAEQSLFHDPDEDISGDVHVGHTHYYSKTHAHTHTHTHTHTHV